MIYRFNRISLDTGRYRIEGAEGSIAVEPRVFDLLVYLVRHRDRVVTREELLASLWQGRVVSDAALSACLKAARKAVGDSGRAQGVIRTVRARGYQFIAEVSEPPDPNEPAESRKPVVAGGSKPSIRIAALDCLPRDEENQTFAEELRDQLLVRLSHRTGVRVIEMSEGNGTPAAATPDYLLRGRIRRMASQYRAGLSMTWCATDETVWAEGFTGDAADPWTFLKEVTDTVDAALRLQFNAYDARRLADRDEQELEPSELLTKAAECAFRISVEDLRHALTLLERVLAACPNDAMALAMRVELGALLAASVPADLHSEDNDELSRMADRSIELNQRSDYAFFARGFLRLHRLHDIQGALDDARKCLQLSPAYVYGLALLGSALMSLGRAEPAVEPLQRAVALDKDNPYHAYHLERLALALFLSGDLTNALDGVNAAIQLHTGVWTYHRLKAAILREQGQHASARESLERASRLSHKPHILAIELPLPASYRAMLDGHED